MSTLPKTYLTPEEYLEIERKAEYKSEDFQGEMFPMSRAGLDDWPPNRPRNASGMRLHVTEAKLFAYPDAMAVCDDRKYLDEQRDTLLNPSLIVEVATPLTEGYEIGLKAEHYRKIEALREYLLLWSYRVAAFLYTRRSDGRWQLIIANRLEDTLDIPSVGCVLRLADLYDQVEL